MNIVLESIIPISYFLVFSFLLFYILSNSLTKKVENNNSIHPGSIATYQGNVNISQFYFFIIWVFGIPYLINYFYQDWYNEVTVIRIALGVFIGYLLQKFYTDKIMKKDSVQNTNDNQNKDTDNTDLSKSDVLKVVNKGYYEDITLTVIGIVVFVFYVIFTEYNK